MMKSNTEDNKTPLTDGGSARNQQNRTGIDSGASGVQRLRDHRDDLQDIADSDLPVAWVADALLDIADDDRDGDGGDGGR